MLWERAFARIGREELGQNNNKAPGRYNHLFTDTRLCEGTGSNSPVLLSSKHFAQDLDGVDCRRVSSSCRVNNRCRPGDGKKMEENVPSQTGSACCLHFVGH